MQWYLKVWRNYANFNGRARRQEYWMFMLFNLLIIFVPTAIELAIKGRDADPGILGYFSAVYLLAALIPSLAVLVRRLHDIGKSGWWVFFNFIPLAGGIVILVFNCLDSMPGSNKYGENPKHNNMAA
ncbi:DUF805 domain-containing protein [Paucisalibacillus globulus]|uniref:DUF805 domain-containing protein n=1 Tax=Paucisalibacillus globulus TaxID=351095 RepID=UPI0003FAF17D|nr:DUF805 domain-containing protein [Paucisalibacillus globulus]